MGDPVEVGGVQGRRQTLIVERLSVATVVPDVSGIDKKFDYAVPESMSHISVGDRVRIDLNGRRVGAWVVGLSPEPSQGVALDKLRPIAVHSGHGVVPAMVDLCVWVADRWHGPLRAALAVASAPKLRSGRVNPRRGRVPRSGDDPVSAAAEQQRSTGGGCLRVPPAASALAVVTSVAHHGPVLVVCPTMRMAALGAAALRRKGLGVALLPDEWATADAGADVVIGARSAVFAPCPGLATIVVIDEHDEALKEERSPAWDATAVAHERGRREGIAVLTTSPVPSVDEHLRVGAPGLRIENSASWPHVEIADLRQVSPASSLLSSGLLQAARDRSLVTLAILNTKGRAVLVACKACGEIQRCPDCRSLLSEAEGHLTCARCDETRGELCRTCGRPSFKALKQGTAGLRSEIERSTGVSPVEVTADTVLDDLRGGLFVGTEALLRRVDHADVVVLCDIDRDLGSPRITASREVLADVARAARVVGSRGKLIVQTRDPEHPLVECLASSDVDAAIATFLSRDMSMREALGLPPYSTLVRLGAERALTSDDTVPLVGVDWSVSGGLLLARVADRVEIASVVAAVSTRSGLRLRVHVGPSRY